MKTARLILIMALALTALTVSADERSYLFNIKLFDITDVSNGMQEYQTLEPFSNPKLITHENKPALMKLSGAEQEDLNFQIEVRAKNKSKFNIKFELFKGQERVSGPIETKDFSSDKTWLMVTNFDKRKLIVSVDMSFIDEQE